VSAGITALVLFAAVLHSGWNAIAKFIPDRLAASSLIAAVYLAAGLAGVAIYGIPSPASWPFLGVSAILQTAYLILLTTSYRHGDFSQVYPLARGLAVLTVAVVATTVLAEPLAGPKILGVGVVGASLLGLSLAGKGTSRLGILFAALTGLFIAGYSLVDGVGVRQSGIPMAYIAWQFLLQGLLIPAACWWLAPSRALLGTNIKTHWRIGVLGGLLSMVAYGIVVWAQAQAPLALVSALRETSVLLAGLIGVVFFSERLSTMRMALTATAVGGIALIQLA
jgi:drug/metabolite transporter (DMT)-like permease